MLGAGERRKLVFHNLALGHPVPTVMAALKLSEKEVLADFDFVARKIRSYRFERDMPPLDVSTIDKARNNRVAALFTLTRMNADKDPKYSRIESLPFTPDTGGRMSEAEQAMLEMRMRATKR